MSSRSVLVCKRILAADDPVLDCVERTYNDSFPEVERRDFSLVRQLIANEPDFQMYVFHREGQYVGFISGWSFDGFRYGEHFAIDPSQRNGGIGSEAMVDLLMIAKYYERIGDHAVNIAKWVLFSLTGNLEFESAYFEEGGHTSEK